MVMDSRVDVSVTVVVSMSALLGENEGNSVVTVVVSMSALLGERGEFCGYCSCIDVSVTVVVSMSALLGERWELRGYGKLYRC